MKNKKMLILIDILFLAVILVKIVFNVLEQIPDIITNLSIYNKKIVILIIGFCVIKSILSLGWLITIYIVFRISYFAYEKASTKHYKEKLDKTDLKSDTYYRDTISQYSPAVLSYIDDFKLDEKDIVATLMSLEIKKRIKVENKIVLLNEVEEGLDENEKYILYNIKNNTINNIDINIFKNKVVSDCLKNSLLVEKKQKDKKILIYFIISYLIVGVFIVLFNLFFNIILVLLFIFIFITAAVYQFAIILYFLSYSIMKNLDPYVRSKKAKDINEKLEGLKNYIEDFSLLKNKEYKDLMIWENYLVYSVILGNNTKIVKDIMKQITNN